MQEHSIFKHHDIRGKYPEEINEETAKKIAAAYYQLFNPDKVVVGYDATEGSNIIQKPFCETLAALGVEVNTLGTTSIPRLYFASAFKKITHGIMITASHLGTKYSGFKFVENSIPSTPPQIQQLKSIFTKPKPTINTHTGKIVPIDITQAYINKIIQFIDTKLTKYNVVIDSSNGPNGLIINPIFSHLEIKSKVINQTVVGKNLKHGTNPKLEENRKDLKHEIFKQNADIGIMWDGDGDRAYFLDSNGKIIPPEFIGITIGKYFIQKGLFKKMTIDVRAATAVEKEISKVKGIVKRIKSWHAPIKEEMLKDNDIGFGMETSGHYVFRNFYKIDDGLLTSLMFLKALEKEKEPLSVLLNRFHEKYYIIEEINFTTQKTEKQIINELKEIYKDGQISLIDGISVDYQTWRFNIRSSRTEPLIRLNISGTNKKDVDDNLGKIKQIVA